MPSGEGSGEAGQQQLILRITINLDAPFGQLQRALMRSIDLTSFGLTAALEPTEAPVLPDVLFQLKLGKRLPLEQLPSEFKTWTLAHGLRDSIEALEPFLEEVWKICWALRVQPGGPRPQEELPALLGDLERAKVEFQVLPVAKKLSKILEEYPSLLTSSWKRAIYSIIGLRNCLVHRRGIVGEPDCRGKGAMAVNWQEMELLIRYEDGSSEPAVKGTVTKMDGWVALKRSWKEKTFPLGAEVQLDTQDFAEIVLTLYSAAMYMRNVFLKVLEDRGIDVSAQKASAATVTHAPPEVSGSVSRYQPGKGGGRPA